MIFTFIDDGLLLNISTSIFPGLLSCSQQPFLLLFCNPFYFFAAFFEFDLNTFIYVDVKYMFTHVTRDGLMLIMGIVHRLCNNLKSFNGSFLLVISPTRISNAKGKRKNMEIFQT